MREIYDEELQASFLLYGYKRINTVVSASRNQNLSVFKFILNKIKDIFESSDDGEETLDQLVVNTLCKLADTATCEAFEMFWKWLQEKIDVATQKTFF